MRKFLVLVALILLPSVLLSATLPNQSVTDEQALADKVRRLEAQLAKTQAQLKNTQQQLTDLKTEKKAVTQPKKIAKTSRWKGTNASLGGVINTGNNTQQNLNSNLDINYKTSRWAYNSAFKVQYNRSSDKGVTADRLNLINQLQHNYANKDFSFIRITYDRDRFDGYDYIFNESVGYGRQFYKSSRLTISGQAGPGLRQTRNTDDGEFNNVLVIDLVGRLIWQINNRTNFSQTVTSGIGQDRIITEANSALTTSLTNKLAVQLNFSLRHVNKVPDSSTSRLTTTTSLNLVYNFV